MGLSQRTYSALMRPGPNGPMAEQVLRALTSIAKSECPVLLMGEHGVGKRTAAAEIHALSARSRESFREVRCQHLDDRGLHEALEMDGTAYLSEVAELTPALQELLLEDYFHSCQPWRCRILFGSSRNLQEEVSAGRMREDFYHLVSSITVHISPVRLRKSEILTISETLLSEYSRQFGRPKPALRDEITAFLLDYTWPDNLPELQTAMKAIVAIGDQAVSLAALKAAGSSRQNGDRRNLSLKTATRQASTLVERQMISRALASTGGNRRRAASELGISYKSLLYKVKQFRLDAPPGRRRVLGVEL